MTSAIEVVMKIRVLAVASLVLASPVWAQSKPPVPSRGDPCAPIGRTAQGELVYSLKCDKPPVPVTPQAAATSPAPAPVAEEKSGLFRNPFTALVGSSGGDDREPGVGPSVGGR